jgi:glycosyltransferase involved in cell wall biosynthesis
VREIVLFLGILFKLVKMKILIVAYACEPGKGSEQGTGWCLALRLAEHHEVSVVTRANNKDAIEADLVGRSGLSLSFIYHDLGFFWLKLKKIKSFPVQLYYTRWLISLSKRFRKDEVLDDFDLVHHLTFNSFEIPPLFLRSVNSLTVWGPIGGGQIAPEDLTTTLTIGARWKERFRGWRVLFSSRNPFVKSTLASCDLVLFANDETRILLEASCRAETGMMVDVGVDPDQFKKGDLGTGKLILFAGKFEYRKGVRLLLKAFERALAKRSDLKMRLVGDGPEREMEKQWIASRSMSDSIEMPGRCSHAEMVEAFALADVFVFPSLRDTTGAIVLEAMASEVPTVCLEHQGARLMVDEESGIRIPVASEEETIEAMANALVDLCETPERREAMGRHARERVIREFSWESKVERLLGEYEKLQKQS